MTMAAGGETSKLTFSTDSLGSRNAMTTTFLIGAGFNVDANILVPPYRATNLYGETYDINAAYPVIS